MGRRRLRDRLRYPGTSELLGAVLVPAIVLSAAPPPRPWALWLATAAVVLLVLQGALYWRLKERCLGQGTPADRRGWARRFRVLRRASAGLVLAAGAGAAWTGTRGEYGDAGAAWLTPGLALLALAEYVNYFHWQLMYDWPGDLRRLRRGLRRSRLWMDLERGSL